MLLSENMNTLTKDWALKRIGRTPIIKSDIFTKSKLNKIEKVMLKYKAIISIVFLLLTQFALYDFDVAEYTTTNHYGTNAKIESIEMPKLESLSVYNYN